MFILYLCDLKLKKAQYLLKFHLLNISSNSYSKFEKSLITVILILLLLDLGFSFYQHYQLPLHGDITDIVLPTPSTGNYKVLHDPFGLNVLINDEKYGNPNRFFAHWTTSTWFKSMPLLLQQFVDPIDSIYLSSAIAKIIIQILLIWLLAVYISNRKNILNLDFLIAALLITPLFQTYGYNRYMGIIDQSVIYSFFYALPLGLLMLFYLPFFRSVYYNKKLKLNIVSKILWALFIVFLTLNGPLVPGVVLIVCPLVLLNVWYRNFKLSEISPTRKRIYFSLKRIPKDLLLFFVAISILSLYSLYIGQNNGFNSAHSISIMERYLRLPHGIYLLVVKKLGFPLIFIMVTVNLIIIRKNYRSEEGDRLFTFIKWIALFAIIYILLIPFGGYRGYRPYMLRYDTIIPLTLALIFVFGSTTFYLIKNISKKYKTVYLTGVILLLLFFTINDNLDLGDNKCERESLEKIARSAEKIVVLDCDCPVMEWVTISDYHHSERNAELFKYWNITKEKKLYYHKCD